MSTPVTHALGQGESFEFEGRTYTLAPWKFGPVQARYEQYLQGRAYKNLLAVRGAVGEAEYLDLRRDLRHDIDGGRYAFYGKVSWDSLDDVQNSKYLFFLCLAAGTRDHPVDQGLVDRIAADPDVGPHAFDLMYQQNLDPNSLAQRKTGTPTPSGPSTSGSPGTPGTETPTSPPTTP